MRADRNTYFWACSACIAEMEDLNMFSFSQKMV